MGKHLITKETRELVEKSYRALSLEDREVINRQCDLLVGWVVAAHHDAEKKVFFGRKEAMEVLSKLGMFLVMGPVQKLEDMLPTPDQAIALEEASLGIARDEDFITQFFSG